MDKAGKNVAWKLDIQRGHVNKYKSKDQQFARQLSEAGNREHNLCSPYFCTSGSSVLLRSRGYHAMLTDSADVSHFFFLVAKLHQNPSYNNVSFSFVLLVCVSSCYNCKEIVISLWIGDYVHVHKQEEVWRNIIIIKLWPAWEQNLVISCCIAHLFVPR